jgi:glycosyltransferase involved in cell wall biosynthesis
MIAESKVAVTVIVAARNEAANMAKCLAALAPAERVIVVDSNSVDGTADIARAAGAEVLNFHYSGSYPKKRQWVLDSGMIASPWVLLIDADEEVTPALWEEIRDVLSNAAACEAYLITKSFHFLGKRLRYGGFSFAAVLLFKTGSARFERTLAESASDLDMEVHERVIVNGKLGQLTEPVLHNDFKSLHAYIDRHNRYSTWEAELRTRYLETNSYGESEVQAKWSGNPQELRRAIKALVIRLPFEPALWWTYHMVFRLGILEGKRGFIAGQIRANYIRQVRAKIFEKSLKDKQSRRLER